jgi:hypothetical protein
MREFATPNEEDRKTARLRFAEYEVHDGLTSDDAIQDAAAPSMAISRLYTVVANPGAALPADVAAAMLRQPRLRAVYRELLARAATFHIPESMAASTDDLAIRAGDGCRIRFEASRAEPDQIYVIVELDDPSGPPPSGLVFCDVENFCASLELTGWRNGVVQLIVERDSDILRLARDPKSMAFLR